MGISLHSGALRTAPGFPFAAVDSQHGEYIASIRDLLGIRNLKSHLARRPSDWGKDYKLNQDHFSSVALC